jgi:hypothetical protein
VDQASQLERIALSVASGRSSTAWAAGISIAAGNSPPTSILLCTSRSDRKDVLGAFLIKPQGRGGGVAVWLGLAEEAAGFDASPPTQQHEPVTAPGQAGARQTATLHHHQGGITAPWTLTPCCRDGENQHTKRQNDDPSSGISRRLTTQRAERAAASGTALERSARRSERTAATAKAGTPILPPALPLGTTRSRIRSM